jgi:predicted thioesterase
LRLRRYRGVVIGKRVRVRVRVWRHSRREGTVRLRLRRGLSLGIEFILRGQKFRVRVRVRPWRRGVR